MGVLKRLTTDIEIELSGETRLYLVSAKQGDKATRYVSALLLNKGIEYEIPAAAHVIANIRKPDGKFCYNDCTRDGNRVLVELTNQALAAAGTATCDIEIRSSDDGEILSSASFTIEIEASMRDESAIESSNEMTAIDNRVKAMEEAEKTRKSNETARQKAETGRVQAETKRENNEANRIAQEKARQENTSQAISNAEKATKNASDAAAAALDVTKRAESALSDQETLERTVNEVVEMKKEVSSKHTDVKKMHGEVQQAKDEIEETIGEATTKITGELVEAVKNYYEQAKALYEGIHYSVDGGKPASVDYLTCDGGSPFSTDSIMLDCGTPYAI